MTLVVIVAVSSIVAASVVYAIVLADYLSGGGK